ncbi:transporter substrate-binding protein, partial [Psychrobacter sp. AOP1-A1-60]
MFSLPTLTSPQFSESNPHNKLKSRVSLLTIAVAGSLSLIGCQKPAETTPSTETTAETTTETTTTPAADGDTIKVGILHSLSGTMAISETSLKDTALMTIDEINANGGVLGKQLEPVVVDPASDWPLFAEKARQLLTQDQVDVIFGGWTSVSRKSVLPVVEELNGLMFYPVQYEGQEQSEN